MSKKTWNTMSNSLKQSMKQRLKSVAKERDLTFDEIWHNLILERSLARLCQSKYIYMYVCNIIQASSSALKLNLTIKPSRHSWVFLLS